MRLISRHWTVLLATTGVLLTSACADSPTGVEQEVAAARMEVTPPPPPLGDDAFFPGLGGGGFFYNCTDQLPPEPGTYVQSLALRASLTMLVAKPGSLAMLRLSTPTFFANQPNMTIAKGAFVQERGGVIVQGKGKVELHPFYSRTVSLFGDLAQATGYLTKAVMYNGVPAREIRITIPITRANGMPFVEECFGSRIETTSAELSLLY